MQNDLKISRARRAEIKKRWWDLSAKQDAGENFCEEEFEILTDIVEKFKIKLA